MRPKRNVFKYIKYLIIIFLILVAWQLISPLFTNKTLVQELPGNFQYNSQQPVVNSGSLTLQVPESFVREEVVGDSTRIESRGVQEQARTSSEEVEQEEQPTTRLTHQANFERVDYDVEGGYKVLQTGSDRLLRIENLSISNGPDLVLALSNSNQAWGNNNYTIISDLPANRGSYNVPIPEGVDPSDYRYLLIHCKQFAHTFASADI